MVSEGCSGEKSGTSQNSDEIVAEHILRSAELSYKMEIERGESISSLASKLLTAISIASVALISLFSKACEQGNPFILNAYGVIFVLLLCAFAFSLLSQYRFKYKTLVSPRDVSDQIVKSNKDEPFLTRTDAAEHFCGSIQESYKSVRRKNNRANRLLRVSVVLLIVAVCLVLVGLIVTWISYIQMLLTLESFS